MTIRIGLIGGGNISETHARAARAISGVEIAAVHGTNAEISPDSAANTAARRITTSTPSSITVPWIS